MRVHRIAIVGLGGISRVHLSAYSGHPERVEVVAGCDPLPERREWARQTYGIERTYASVAEMVDAGGWDVAVVCTPSFVRAEALAELAAAGKHILVEKPLSDNVDDARAIVERCEKAGIILAVNQNFRNQYAFNVARDLIAAGRIGEVLGIDQQDLTFRQDKGWRLGMDRHAMSVMGVHWFDGFRVLLGREASWVSCRTYSSPAIECAGETDAFVHVYFDQTPVSYVQSFSSSVRHTETLVFGERGTIRLDYAQATVVSPDGETSTVPNPYAGERRPESMFASLDRLLTAIEDGGEPSNSGRDNLRTVALLDAAYRSAAQRTPVELVKGLPW